jgi:Flp pilus assembly protein TadG
MELVFILPLILVLLFVILDFAIVIDRRSSLDHAIREGTRAAARGDSIAQVRALTVSQSDGLLSGGNVEVCYEDMNNNNNAGNIKDNVKVTVTHTYDFVLGGELLDFFGVSSPSITLAPTAQDKLEQEITVAPQC